MEECFYRDFLLTKQMSFRFVRTFEIQVTMMNVENDDVEENRRRRLIGAIRGEIKDAEKL